MPLQKGVSQSIAELVGAGYSREQAAAIAYHHAGEDDGLPAPETARQYDINGWFTIEGNPISKSGIFPYRGRSIDPDGSLGLDPDEIYNVFRPPEELADPECLASFALLPFVDDHTMIGPAAEQEAPGQAVPAEIKGVAGIIGEKVYFDGEYLRGNLKVFSDSVACLINDGKIELSAGYRCYYDATPGVYNGQQYIAVQRRIRGNHLALVDEGRCGPDVSVLDHLKITLDAKEIDMDKKDVGLPNKKPIAASLAGLKFPVAGKAQDGDEGEGAGTMTIQQVSELLGQVVPVIQQLQEQMAALMPLEKKEHPELAKTPDAAKDDDAVPGGAEDKEATPAAAMDAAEISRNIRADIALAGKLYKQVSEFTGAFAADEMDAASVASYAVTKLGIPAVKGSEISAVRAWLHGRAVPSATATDAQDAGHKPGPISAALMED